MLRSTLLLINSLLLYSNVLLAKKSTILHILERVKETQVKVLGKEPSLPDGLVESFAMLLHDLLLVNKKLLLKLLAGLPLLGSSQLGLRSALHLANQVLSLHLQVFVAFEQFITIQPGTQQLGQHTTNFGRQLVRPMAKAKMMVAFATLEHSIL